MKKLILGIALLALINTSFAQRKGAIDTGGSVSFLNHSGVRFQPKFFKYCMACRLLFK